VLGVGAYAGEVAGQELELLAGSLAVLGATLVELRVPVKGGDVDEELVGGLVDLVDARLLLEGVAVEPQLARQVAVDRARLTERQRAVLEQGELAERRALLEGLHGHLDLAPAGRGKKNGEASLDAAVDAVRVLDQGSGVALSALGERLGLSAAALKKTVDALVESGRLMERKKRPRLLSCAEDGTDGAKGAEP
jgi:biotin operon repressor